jgi:hypothetical protein
MHTSTLIKIPVQCRYLFHGADIAWHKLKLYTTVLWIHKDLFQIQILFLKPFWIQTLIQIPHLGGSNFRSGPEYNLSKVWVQIKVD